MQLKIQDGKVDLSGNEILSKVDIEICDADKIGIVGRNGCGKTTLLKLISGELHLSNEENDGSMFIMSGKPVIGMLSQMTFKDDSALMIDEIRSAYSDILSVKSQLDKAQSEMEESQSEESIKNYTSLLDYFTVLGGFYFEKEYEAAIKHFGFSEEEKLRPLSDFSGGQRTKIAFLKLLLSKPDILLLDEPTNHLDIEAVEWLEEYISDYKKAVVIVSHDRMFLDNTVNTIYEIEHGKTYKYAGNYSKFIEEKKLLRERQAKEYERQQKEIARLEEIVDRFKYKPTKAAMAQSKLKQIERMELIDSPEKSDTRAFHTNFEPDDMGVKDVLFVKDLEIGFDKPLSTVSVDVKRGMKIGIIGGNGLGKSTFIKTLMGAVPPLSGEYKFGPRVKIGYFDQQMAQYSSNSSVLDDFLSAYPTYTPFEARKALGAFLFSGEDVFKTVNMLSGGERVRLALCKIFNRRPNLLILDEPTNHMDIVGKETLENILCNFGGTVLFVSHDRYFVKKISDSLLVFENGEVKYFPYGYTQYTEQKKQPIAEEPIPPTKPSGAKKKFTTPAKEKSRLERAVKKNEEQIALLEEQLDGLKEELNWEENISDYLKLDEISKQIESTECALSAAMKEWEQACESLEKLEVTGI